MQIECLFLISQRSWPVSASQSCQKGSRPRSVGEYETYIFQVFFVHSELTSLKRKECMQNFGPILKNI